MTLEIVSFEGFECVRLDDAAATVIVTVSAGPRILGLLAGEENLFAVVPDSAVERPDGERVRLLGGHRLWASPEIPDITYQPDGLACDVAEVEAGVRVEAPADGAGLIKAIEVRQHSGGWVVDHVLRNASERPRTIAPWAITQLRLGGEAVVPMAARGSGPQADRSLVLWPYTDLLDPRLRFGRDEIRIDAAPGGAALKIGAAPSGGRVSYRLSQSVFEKRIDVDPKGSYPDRGAAVQVYLCDEFCELETLGPARVVEPDGTATHRERWTLRRKTSERDRPPEP